MKTILLQSQDDDSASKVSNYEKGLESISPDSVSSEIILANPPFQYRFPDLPDIFGLGTSSILEEFGVIDPISVRELKYLLGRKKSIPPEKVKNKHVVKMRPINTYKVQAVVNEIKEATPRVLEPDDIYD